MAVDLKSLQGVLIAKAVRVMLETLAKDFFEFAKEKQIFAKVSRKLDINESLSLYTLQLVKGYHLLPPGVLVRMVPHHR